MSETIRVQLNEDEMPRAWYNIAADFSKPMPPPLGRDGKPVTAEMLAPVFPMNLIEQEVSTQRWIPIPDEVRQILYRWRPTPMRRAVGLERALGTPARIYFKDESVSPAGSHKCNTSVAQAYYNREYGIKRMTTETGAGQWGAALAMACKLMGVELRVYMVRVSFDQKPMRKMMMNTWGAECLSSPTNLTQAGRDVLAKWPDTPGSLGIAISEAIEDCVNSKNTRYGLGSVLNHVLLHQTIIGLEAKEQFKKIGRYPDIIIGCAGGGSNFAGIAFPFLADKIAGSKSPRVTAVEPSACPKMTKGVFAYDAGDVAMMTPLLPMYTLGHEYQPAAIHAGGLRYHGMAPLVSHALRQGLIDAVAIPQVECFAAAVQFAETEGLIPAPESSHAIAQAIREAKQAKEEGREKTILFNLSGNGVLDLSGYQAFKDGKLIDHIFDGDDLKKSLSCIKGLPKPPPL
ncbi:MAG: TrpB-like pyridoxal phosphate-dependent enzyme [Kiritimatiellae bacterium]|nr:TrpB-like pyridoxal phosphate-dependent enzyme [Kiritimatiellia bacterium]